jgi:glyoxylase-like metal-dependent hydrolase (beta-lactamase superfamily II)
MKIHHLNCGTLHPRLIKAEAIVYCLLLESSEGLILVDTGFGTKDYSTPSPRMKIFCYLAGVPGVREETALHQVLELGFQVEDVKHIVLTHLHLDHAGGLRDFPNAYVHVFKPEYCAAMKPRGGMELAYDSSQWAHDPKWVFHEQIVGNWYGFECVPVLASGGIEILFIPLPGHTRGHCGVVVGKAGEWLFQCGDAASPFHSASDLHHRDPSHHYLNFLPRRFARWVIGPHVPRLRSLIQNHGEEVRVISSHDIYSFRENIRAERG